MATYLQLVQKLQQRTGVGGSDIAQVASQTGAARRLATYVAEAWTEIQAMRRDWSFRWSELSLSVPASASTDFDVSAALGGGEIRAGTGPFLLVKVSDTTQRRTLELMDKPHFDRLYERTRGVATAGFPAAVTVLPSGTKLRFNVPPDVNYTLSGPYYTAQQVLAINGDIPDMPARYHDAIFYRALMRWAEFEEAPDVYATARQSWEMWQTTLANDLTPKILVGADALA